jgi:hypothetical protein
MACGRRGGTPAQARRSRAPPSRMAPIEFRELGTAPSPKFPGSSPVGESKT